MEVSALALCRVQTFGTSANALWRLGKVEETEAGFQFELIYKNRSAGTFRTPLFGEHNLLNLISGIACAVNLGASIEKIRPIVERFHGAKRRQEVLLKKPVLLVDDFAHHPTEVAATLKSVRRRYPKGKLWAFFEPRSATARRNVHQQDYVQAFDSADQILIANPYRSADLGEGERFSSDTLATDLAAKGKQAQTFATVKEMVDNLVTGHQPGDIVVVMSNGEFDKIQEKIIRAFS
jgi:UDP-N-acetylmuramate: L-alanyl-gamma-D-glutamyl-meso-diaminopimelate ligase